MEPLTQSALWQLVLGLAGVILTLAGVLYVIDKRSAAHEENARAYGTRESTQAQGKGGRTMRNTDSRPHIGIGNALLALAMLALAAAPATAQQDLGNLMRQKLDRAQGLFEAVVLARFPAAGRYAGDLLRISEQSTWTPTATPSYLRHAGEFQEAARDLGRAAADRNIDDLSTAYMTLTSTCVQCHRMLRESRQAERNRAPGPHATGARGPHPLRASGQ
jgi:hypothetical protein